MYYLVRFILLILVALILFFVLKIKHLRLQKKENFIYVFFFLQLYLLFSIIPFERDIVLFQTPKEAFTYLHPFTTPDKIMKTDECAFILYNDFFDGSFVNQKKGKWQYKARHIKAERIKGRIRSNKTQFFISSIKNEECNEQLILVNEVIRNKFMKQAAPQDSLHSTFIPFTYEDDSSKEVESYYYAVIPADVTDYELIIEGRVAKWDGRAWSGDAE